jgi:hypothetical protein
MVLSHLFGCPSRIINPEPVGRLSGPLPFYFYFSNSNNSNVAACKVLRCEGLSTFCLANHSFGGMVLLTACLDMVDERDSPAAVSNRMLVVQIIT